MTGLQKEASLKDKDASQDKCLLSALLEESYGIWNLCLLQKQGWETRASDSITLFQILFVAVGIVIIIERVQDGKTDTWYIQFTGFFLQLLRKKIPRSLHNITFATHNLSFEFYLSFVDYNLAFTNSYVKLVMQDFDTWIYTYILIHHHISNYV